MRVENYRDEKVHTSRYAIIRWFGFDQFVPERAVTSHWVSSKVFFGIRFILALYSTIVFWTYLGLVAAFTNFNWFFAQFTTLTFIGLHAYLITSLVHHFRYLRSKNMNFMLNQPSFLNYLYVYLYCTITTFNILTPVVFWSILNDGITAFPVVNWLNISVHGASFFLMIFDVIFNRMVLPIRMVLFVFFTVIFYMFVTFIIFADTGKWVYPFLDWSQGPMTALWYFMVAIIVVVAYFVMVFIHWLRGWIARKTGRSVAPISDNEEVKRANDPSYQEKTLEMSSNPATTSSSHNNNT